ncbi:NAD(P)-binding protein [Pisolithus albus]|nr:NAD(P)-binding protein [Pisolithus albus]
MGVSSSKTKFDPHNDLPDLTGRVILVTGGNRGLGYATIRHLVRKGAKVYLAARNGAKAEAAIARLKEEGSLTPGNGEVVKLELDLCDPRNAKKAAQEFMSKEDRLDVLIHNAAVLIESSYEMLPDGVQKTMMVNLISPFVLTRELLPILRKTASQPDSDVRIVVVASSGQRLLFGKPRFRTIQELNDECRYTLVPGFTRYCRSKLANVLYASELDRCLSSSTVPYESNIIAVSPGISRLRLDSLVDWLASFVSVTPDIGAYNSVYAAVVPVVRTERWKYGGGFMVPVGVSVTPGEGVLKWWNGGPEVTRKADGQDASRRKTEEDQEWEERGRELWETVERFLREKGI